MKAVFGRLFIRPKDSSMRVSGIAEKNAFLEEKGK